MIHIIAYIIHPVYIMMYLHKLIEVWFNDKFVPLEQPCPKTIVVLIQNVLRLKFRSARPVWVLESHNRKQDGGDWKAYFVYEQKFFY